MKIAIIGYEGQGESAYHYWNKPENDITICDLDANKQIPSGVKAQLGPDYLKNLGSFDMLVRTPIVHPSDIQKANPDIPDILDKVWSNTNEFFKICPTKNIIGVTGTKGKGTTSTLITRMLDAAGLRVHLGGNIGIPPLDMLSNNIQPEDWVVLELANFQLIDLKASPHIGVCLMVVPEHMNWHPDMNEYAGAKQQLFKWQNGDDFAIYFAENENSKQIVEASKGHKIPYYAPPGARVQDGAIVIDDQEICKTNEIKLLGEHNWQNVCAAITAAWQVTQDAAAIRSAITSFAGLEYHLEFVRELDGVKYYNDAFGTTPETAEVAVTSFKEPIVLILGGSTKNSDYAALAKTIKNNSVKQVILIGNTAHPQHKPSAPDIERALADAGVTNVTSLVKAGPTSMQDIVAAARKAAAPGDIVLLSAGSASFDLFKNYKDRGVQFTDAVQELA